MPTNSEEERRHLHALRQHIDSLLAGGASLVGRDPVRIDFEGRVLVVREGMLISEDGSLDFVERLTQQQWQDPAAAEAAMAICLKLLGRALDNSSGAQPRTATPPRHTEAAPARVRRSAHR